MVNQSNSQRSKSSKIRKQVNIATWNVYNAMDDISLAQYAKSAKKLNISVAALQETRRPGEQLEDFFFPGEELRGWRFIGSGSIGTSTGGVGFVIAPGVEVVETHQHAQPAWGRILSVRVEIKGIRMKITTSYAPHNGHTAASKDTFYSQLEKATNELDKFPKFKALHLGDYNAVVSEDAEHRWGPVCKHVCGSNNTNVRDTNDNGLRLLEYCRHRGYSALNTFFPLQEKTPGNAFPADYESVA